MDGDEDEDEDYNHPLLRENFYRHSNQCSVTWAAVLVSSAGFGSCPSPGTAQESSSGRFDWAVTAQQRTAPPTGDTRDTTPELSVEALCALDPPQGGGGGGGGEEEWGARCSHTAHAHRSAKPTPGGRPLAVRSCHCYPGLFTPPASHTENTDLPRAERERRGEFFYETFS